MSGCMMSGCMMSRYVMSGYNAQTIIGGVNTKAITPAILRLIECCIGRIHPVVDTLHSIIKCGQTKTDGALYGNIIADNLIGNGRPQTLVLPSSRALPPH